MRPDWLPAGLAETLTYRSFATEAGGRWEVWFTESQLRLWRIRKTTPGVLPPWRESADVDPQPPRRWWVFHPHASVPCAITSTWELAMRHVEDSAIAALIMQNPSAAERLNYTRREP